MGASRLRKKTSMAAKPPTADPKAGARFEGMGSRLVEKMIASIDASDARAAIRCG